MTKQQITETFDQLKEKNQKAFIAYIVAGDGGLDQLKNQILKLEEQGVDIVELGIPFSDPVADGPVIQEAGARAIEGGVTLKKILDELEKIKEEISIPVVLMSYINPIYSLGLENFTERAQNANVSGVILPDVPYEEEAAFKQEFDKGDFSIIRLLTLTSSNDRLHELTSTAEGFIYAVTVKGTTGIREGYSEETYDYLDKLTKMSPVPVCAGFGIGSKDLAEKVGGHSDGVIVGSKIVNYLHDGTPEKIGDLIPDKN